MAQPLDSAALDQLFDKARTHNKWQPREVPDELLKAIVEHMKWGPTSANCSPARIVFVKSQEAKARLKPHLSPGNVEKTMAAPATAILAYDLRFYDYLPRLYPPRPTPKAGSPGRKSMPTQRPFATARCRAAISSLRRVLWASIAARCPDLIMLGLMPSFSAGTDIKSNFLCNLAYGDPVGGLSTVATV